MNTNLEKKKQKLALFHRLDEIKAGIIPLGKIGSLAEEAQNVGMTPPTYRKLGSEWVSIRHPEVPFNERQIKLREYYKFNRREKKFADQLLSGKNNLFDRLDAIESGKVHIGEIGSQIEEAKRVGLNQEQYIKCGIGWVAINFKRIPPKDRHEKLKEFYGWGAKKKSLFKRLDDIEAKKIHPSNIGSLQEEARLVGMKEIAYLKFGTEWLESRHPEIDPLLRDKKFKEYSGSECRIKLGQKDKIPTDNEKEMEIFDRLDAINRGEVAVEKIGTQLQEATLLGISQKFYCEIGKKWVSIRFPGILPENQLAKLSEFYGRGAGLNIGGKLNSEPFANKIQNLYKRLDALGAGQVPINEIGTLVEEVVNLGLDPQSYLKYGKNWVGTRYPQIETQDRRTKLAEYYGLGARKKGLFSRLDAIDKGEVPLNEIGTLLQEAALFQIGQKYYKKWGEEWIALNYSSIPIKDRSSKLKEYYGLGIRRLSLFSRLDAIDNGIIPFNEIGTLKDESKKVDLWDKMYVKMGQEWIALRYPEIPPEKSRYKLTEYYGSGTRKKALFDRLDAIDRGEISLIELRNQEEEASCLGVKYDTYLRWGEEWVANSYPEIHPYERSKKFQEYSAANQKKKHALELARKQIAIKKSGEKALTLMEIAEKSGVGVATLVRSLMPNLITYYEDQGFPTKIATVRAEKTYKSVFPQDLSKLIGHYTHIILEEGVKQVLEYQYRMMELSPVLFKEKKEGAVTHDLLIRDCHRGNWFLNLLQKASTLKNNNGIVLDIPITMAEKYERISIDFTSWEDTKRIVSKSIKYSNEKTFLLIILTNQPPLRKEDAKMIRDYPHVRVISAEDLFHILEAPISAEEKNRLCCSLSRQKKVKLLEKWALQIKEKIAPSFLEGQKNLKKWLKQAELSKRSEPAIIDTPNEIACIKPHLRAENNPEEGFSYPNLILDDTVKGNRDDPYGFGDEGDGKGFFDDMNQESAIGEEECDADSGEEIIEEKDRWEGKISKNGQKPRDLVDENVIDADLDENIRDEEDKNEGKAEEEDNPDDEYEGGYY